MEKIKSHIRIALIVIGIVLFIDQSSKIAVAMNMEPGDEISVISDKFLIHYVENPGMAFGMEIGGNYGKLILSLIRIIAVSFIGFFLFKQIKTGITKGAAICGAMIFAGALGNILDSLFYGYAFDNAIYLEDTPILYPLFHGKVVDMLYFPLFRGVLPEWIPIWGGEYTEFFRPVFNVADFAISLGVGILIVFQKRLLLEEPSNKNTETEEIAE